MTCPVGAFLGRFDGADRKRLQTAINDEALNPWTVVKGLIPLTPRFSGAELTAHRNGYCGCEVE